MAGAQITVVSDSIAIRECIEVALAARYGLSYVTAATLAPHASALAYADLVICDADITGAALDRAGRILRVFSQPTTNNGPEPKIAYPFRPEELRLAVQRALALPGRPQPPPAAEPSLASPWLPLASARLAAAAVRYRLPVLLCGESGCGKRRLAQYIHDRSGGGHLLTLAAAHLGTLPRATVGTTSAATLVLTEIAALDTAGAAVVDEWIQSIWATANPAPRIIATSTRNPDELATLPALGGGLFDRIAVVPIHLPPLRDRSDEIGAIAADIIAAVAVRGAITPPPRLTDAAIIRLQRYPWPGNLSELEAVLARSVALHGSPEIDAEDLAFDVGGAAPAIVATMSPPSSTKAPTETHAEAAEAAPELVVLLNELAHELKNPMVAVKAAAQHLGRSTGNDASRDDAARLAGEAVDRMDQVVENMLQFGHFGRPCPEAVRISDLVAPALDAVDSELDVRRIQLDDRIRIGAMVWVDRQQATYAVENILRAALRAAGDGAPLCLRSDASGPTLAIEFPASTGSVAAKLAKWSSGNLLGPAIEPSIRLVFARSLLERNGGHVDIATENGTTRVHIDLPLHRGEVEEVGGG